MRCVKKLNFQTVCLIISLMCIAVHAQAGRGVQAAVDSLGVELSQVRLEVQQLKREIQSLRKLLALDSSASSNKENSAFKEEGVIKGAAADCDTCYWCNQKSNTRHNSNCKYFKTTNGRPCSHNDGKPCKKCGG